MTTLISEQEINEINKRIGKELTELLKNEEKTPVIIVVLKGATMFAMDLAKEIKCPLQYEFVQYSSYAGGMNSSKNLILKKDITMDIENRTVILVDDILDTGETLRVFKEHVKRFNPKAIYTCVLLDKKGRREEGYFSADFVGKSIDNLFVCGYGLDYQEIYRNYKDIFVINDEEIKFADNLAKK